ncbi:MAG: hypothetical protein ACYDCH_15940, partial [Gaiellaceae bacterium]
MAAHATRYSTLDLPRPGRAAVPLLALAAVALMLDIDPRLPWIAGAAGALFFVAAAAGRWFRSHRELTAVRRTADRLIVHEPRSRDASELVRWRSAELTTPTRRARGAKEVRATLRQLDPGRLRSASPLQRPAARR